MEKTIVTVDFDEAELRVSLRSSADSRRLCFYRNGIRTGHLSVKSYHDRLRLTLLLTNLLRASSTPAIYSNLTGSVLEHRVGHVKVQSDVTYAGYSVPLLVRDETYSEWERVPRQEYLMYCTPMRFRKFYAVPRIGDLFESDRVYLPSENSDSYESVRLTGVLLEPKSDDHRAIFAARIQYRVDDKANWKRLSTLFTVRLSDGNLPKMRYLAACLLRKFCPVVYMTDNFDTLYSNLEDAKANAGYSIYGYYRVPIYQRKIDLKTREPFWVSITV